MDGQTLIISCQGATTVPLDELTDLQGNLKDLTEDNYVKLRNSLTEYGFSFPIFMWIDPNNTKWILDAHQRIRTLKKMREEGYSIPDLPADIIYAESKTHAKKKLLLLNSRYGKITREGYDAFIDEPGAEILERDMDDFLEIPEVQLFADPLDISGGVAITSDQSSEQEKDKEITCPACKYRFRSIDSAQ